MFLISCHCEPQAKQSRTKIRDYHVRLRRTRNDIWISFTLQPNANKIGGDTFLHKPSVCYIMPATITFFKKMIWGCKYEAILSAREP